MSGELLALGLLVPGALATSWLAGRGRGRARWSGLDALFVLAVMVTASSLAASAMLRALGIADATGRTDLLGVFALGTGLGGVLSAGCVLLRAEAGALGLRRPVAAAWWGWAVLSAVGFFGLSLGWGVVLERLGVGGEQGLVTLVRTAGLTPETLGVVAYGVLVAPVVEELLFRGFLLAPLVRGLGPVGGAAGTAALFGLMHMSDPQAVPPLVVMGGLLAWLRLRSGSLGPPLALHVLNNAAALGLLLAGQGAGG